MKIENEELQQQINAYIEGDLPPDQAARLEIYIANADPVVSQEIISMIADRAAVKALPRTQAPTDLAAHIMEKIERTSLLNGVDQELVQSRRRWWQSKHAIAAGLAVVLSGFGFFVYQAVYRPANQWHEVIATGGPGAGGPAKVTAPEAVIGKSGSGETGGSIADKSANTSVDVDAGHLLAVLKDAPTVEDQLARAKVAANLPVTESLANGFTSAPNATVAISNVTAVQKKVATPEPMLLCLLARDNADPQRLHSMIEQFIVSDTETAKRQDALASTVRYNSTNPVARSIVNSGNNDVPADNLLNSHDQVANAGQQARRDIKADGQQGAQQGGQQGAMQQPQQYVEQSKDYVRNEDLQFRELRGYNERGQRAVAGNYGKGGGGKLSGDAGWANGSAAAPYRVKLRQEQLQTITNTFNVHSITRGQQAYVIANAGGNRYATPATTAAVKEGTDAAGASGGGVGDTKAVAATETKNKMDVRTGTKDETPAPMAPATSNAGKEVGKGAEELATTQMAEVQKQDDGQWLEVIITMEMPGRLNFRGGNTLQFNQDANLNYNKLNQETMKRASEQQQLYERQQTK